MPTKRTTRGPRRAIIRPATTPAATEASPGTPKTRPVGSGPKCSTFWRYSVVRKTSPASIEKMVSAARLPHRTNGSASISIATNGAFARRSIQKNSASKIIPTSNAGRDPSVMPKARAKRPSVTDAAPGMSSRTFSRERPAGTTNSVNIRITRATGTLIRNAQRQLSTPTSIPPTSAPTVKPPESSEPFKPNTRARCLRQRRL